MQNRLNKAYNIIAHICNYIYNLQCWISSYFNGSAQEILSQPKLSVRSPVWNGAWKIPFRIVALKILPLKLDLQNIFLQAEASKSKVK